ncbi:Phytohormone-binding protein CSBP [Camellia lanceoleosa]|uniref:Phytohormone-binding protein CSBP n=1 Tax=Camellia lanceoleosa TaxID=1840588 RepID=A0ACC0GNK9_9ERIC|nr:Phytohormone-binding protein CSBP [Camellia lanceoleosa]
MLLIANETFTNKIYELIICFAWKQISDVFTVSYQKEKIVDLDESLHQIGMQVIEGGHLNHGFSSYKTIFQLTANAESETLVDVKVEYDIEAKETKMPAKTIKSALAFIKCLESYLLTQST